MICDCCDVLWLVRKPVSHVEEDEDEREQQATRYVYYASSFLVASDALVARHLQQTTKQCVKLG